MTEKEDLYGEKNGHFSIVAKKTLTPGWLQIMIIDPKQATCYNYFFVFPYYVHIMFILKLRLNLGTLKLICPKLVY